MYYYGYYTLRAIIKVGGERGGMFVLGRVT